MIKIVKSLAMIALVGAVALGITGAYFSDEEKSTGNTFTAGKLDLKIDNECSWSGGGDCPWHNVTNPDDSSKTMLAEWTEDDLVDGVHKFFYFDDLKPGDWGEDTISIHVVDNDAWGRIYFSNVSDLDNDCTEPEIGDEPACETSPTGSEANSGELDDEMTAMIWLDQGLVAGFQCSDDGETARCTEDPKEGDNIWQDTEPVIVEGIDNIFLAGIDLKALIAGAASVSGEGDGLNLDGHLTGCITYYIGMSWCFGSYDAGTSVCNGGLVNNKSQSDSLGGDMTFEVTQYRNQGYPAAWN